MKNINKCFLPQTTVGMQYHPPMLEFSDYLLRNKDSLVELAENRWLLSKVEDNKAIIPNLIIPALMMNNVDFNPFKPKFVYVVDYRKNQLFTSDLFNLAAQLDILWNDEVFNEDFNGLTILPCKVYCNWISKKLGVRFNLTPQETMKAQVIAAIFYLTRSDSDWLIDPSRFVNYRMRITKATGLPESFIDDIFNTLEPEPFHTQGLRGLVYGLKAVSPRLEKVIDERALLTLVSRDWVGQASPVITGLSLEHIPTFLSMLYFSITTSSFRQTQFTKLVGNFVLSGTNKRLGDIYARALTDLVKELQR